MTPPKKWDNNFVCLRLLVNQLIVLFLRKEEGIIEAGLDSIVYIQIPFFKGNTLLLDGFLDAIAFGGDNNP